MSSHLILFCICLNIIFRKRNIFYFNVQLSLFGSNLDYWYSQVDKKGAEYNQLMDFTQREETYQLKIFVNENSKWAQSGIINGGGAFSIKKRVIPLDISNVEGDTLMIRINPPKGFWAINYIAVEYDENFTMPLCIIDKKIEMNLCAF